MAKKKLNTTTDTNTLLTDSFALESSITTPMLTYKELEPEFLDLEEEKAKKELIRRYGPLGFSFDESGLGDNIVITSPDKKEKIEVPFDQWLSVSREFNAKKINSFLEKHKPSEYTKEQIEASNNIPKEAAKIIDLVKNGVSDEKNINIKNQVKNEMDSNTFQQQVGQKGFGFVEDVLNPLLKAESNALFQMNLDNKSQLQPSQLEKFNQLVEQNRTKELTSDEVTRQITSILRNLEDDTMFDNDTKEYILSVARNEKEKAERIKKLNTPTEIKLAKYNTLNNQNIKLYNKELTKHQNTNFTTQEEYNASYNRLNAAAKELDLVSKFISDEKSKLNVLDDNIKQFETLEDYADNISNSVVNFGAAVGISLQSNLLQAAHLALSPLNSRTGGKISEYSVLLNDLINKQRNYLIKEPENLDWSNPTEVVRIGMSGLAENLPLLVASTYTGGMLGGAVLFGLSGGSQKSIDMFSEEIKSKGSTSPVEYSTKEHILAPLFVAGAESLTAIPEMLILRGKLNRGGKFGGFGSLLGYSIYRKIGWSVLKPAKTFTKGLGLEISQEVVTEVGQNATDKFYLGKNVNLADGIDSKFLAKTFFTTGSVSTVAGARQMYSNYVLYGDIIPYSEQQRIQLGARKILSAEERRVAIELEINSLEEKGSETNKLQTLKKQLESVNDELNLLEQQQELTYYNTSEKFGKTGEVGIDKLRKLSRKTAALQSKAQKINNDKNLSSKERNNFLKPLKEQFNVLESQKADILNNKNFLATETNYFKKKFRDKATEVLKIKGVDITEDNLSKEAEKIYRKEKTNYKERLSKSRQKLITNFSDILSDRYVNQINSIDASSIIDKKAFDTLDEAKKFLEKTLNEKGYFKSEDPNEPNYFDQAMSDLEEGWNVVGAMIMQPLVKDENGNRVINEENDYSEFEKDQIIIVDSKRDKDRSSTIHEIFHGILWKAFKASGIGFSKMSKQIMDELKKSNPEAYNIIKKAIVPAYAKLELKEYYDSNGNLNQDKINKDPELYESKKKEAEEMQAEETITWIAQLMAQGNIKRDYYEKSIAQKIKNSIITLLPKSIVGEKNAELLLNDGADMLALIADFTKSFDAKSKGEISKDLKKLISGKFKISEDLKPKKQKIEEVTGKSKQSIDVKEINTRFSQENISIYNKKTNVNLSKGSGKKLNEQVDDLTKNAKTKSEFISRNGGFDNVYNGILAGKFDQLFPLATNQGTDLSNIEQRNLIRYFLSDRLMNYDPAKSSSLYAWMVGNPGKGIPANIYFSKEDANKVLATSNANKTKSLDSDESFLQIESDESGLTASEAKVADDIDKKPTIKESISISGKSEAMTNLRGIVENVISDLNIGAREVESTTKVSDFVAILKEKIQGKKPGTAFKLLRRAFKVGNSTVNEYRQNLIKNKEAILKGLTTSYLSRAFPPAIEKRIITEDGGTKFVKSEEWLKIPKKNIGKKPGFIDIRSTKEEGYEGDTTGKQAMRRVENIAETISDEVFLAKYIINNKVPQMPSEMLMQQLAGEIGLDIFQEEINKFDEFNTALENAALKGESVEEIMNSDKFKIISSFVDNQKLLKNVIIESTISNLTKQLERGTTKYSILIDGKETEFSNEQIKKINNFLNEVSRIILSTKSKEEKREEFNTLLNNADDYIIQFYDQIIENNKLVGGDRIFGSVVEIQNALEFAKAVQESGQQIVIIKEVSASNSQKGDILFYIKGKPEDIYRIESKINLTDEFSSLTSNIKSDGTVSVNAPKDLKTGTWVLETFKELDKQGFNVRSDDGKLFTKRTYIKQDKAGILTRKAYDNIIASKELEWQKSNEEVVGIIEDLLENTKQNIKNYLEEYNKEAKKLLSEEAFKGHEKSNFSGGFIKEIIRQPKLEQLKSEIAKNAKQKGDGTKELFKIVEQIYLSGGVDIAVVNKRLYGFHENIDGINRLNISNKKGVHKSPDLDLSLYLKQGGVTKSNIVYVVDGKNKYETRFYSLSTSFKIASKNLQTLKNNEKNYTEISDNKGVGSIYNNYAKSSLLIDGIPMNPLVVDPNFGDKKAILVVGGVGSGKTTTVNKIINKLNLKKLGFNVLDEDIERSKIQLDKTISKASAYEKAKKSVNKKYKDLSENKKGIIYDLLGTNKKNTTKIADDLKAKGYDVSMILIDTSVDLAVKRDAGRERTMGEFLVEFTNGFVERNKDFYAKEFDGSFTILDTDNLKLEDPLPSNFVEQVKSSIKYAIDPELLDTKFNDIIQETKGVHADKTFSDTIASLKGAGIGKYKFFVPPSADDFMGLMYAFMGRGSRGDLHTQFFEEVLNAPYKRGIAALESAKQKMQDNYATLKKKYPKVAKKLGKKIPDSEFTYDQAIRVYLWKYNNEVFDTKLEEELGLTTSEINKLFFTVAENRELQQYARNLGKLTGLPEGYIKPSKTWLLETIASDLNDITDKVNRRKFLTEFIENKEAVFNKENLNKIQAIYGTRFREALEDSLYAMTNGTSRNFGDNKIANQFADWLNGSVGAIMFVNARSASLQLLSNINYLNWSDNNIFQASAAFANQKQFWEDFKTIIMSDKLRQRRKGLNIDVQAAELSNSVATSKSKYRSALRYLLRIGFTPTQAADATAIAFGGAAFYRNRIKSLMKDGFTKEQAEEKAWYDFSEITDSTQQSADPSMVSQEQRNPFTRFILTFQNVAMQYNRKIKKAGLNLVNRRGSDIENISKIIYYGAVQNFIFNAVQQAMFAMIWGDDESEEKEKERFFKVGNAMLDTILRGAGWKLALVATLKNTYLKYQEEEAKGSFKADHIKTGIQFFNVAPSVGSKLNKIYKGYKIKNVYEKDVIKEKGYSWDSPIWRVYGNYVSAAANIPVDRALSKVDNLVMASKSYTDTWQKVALSAGWPAYSLGLKNKENEIIKIRGAEERKRIGIEKAKRSRAITTAKKRAERAAIRQEAINK